MFSTPAATTTSIVPAMTACAACIAACMEEPHMRFTDVPATDSGNPAIIEAIRPML